MSRTLILLRHAKSSWKESGLDDHERPLNKRGQHDAPRMGRLLVEQGIVPDRIVSSTAVRARTTAAEVASACDFPGEIVLSRRLYLAAPATYVEIASELGSDAETAMFVGHNPGIEELVELLTGQDETMPTAALACIRLPIDGWADLGPATCGELLGFWRPKEL